ncbi:MAG: BPSS1780 family membrane protein [Methylotenera sp.]
MADNLENNLQDNSVQTQPLQIRQVPAGNAWAWIASGFQIFKAYPLMWIVLFIIYLIIVIPLSFIPVLGTVFGSLVAPVFAAGMMIGCAAVMHHQELEINHLFAGFKKNTGQLVAVGGIYLAALLLISVLIVMSLDQEIIAQMVKGQELTQEQAASAMKPTVLIAMLLLIPVLMAYWFAPLLVRLHDLTALEAMKMSFMAVFRNIAPVILYALIFIALTILAVIPFGLGLLVVVPVMITSTYTSYLDIFNIKQD